MRSSRAVWGALGAEFGQPLADRMHGQAHGGDRVDRQIVAEGFQLRARQQRRFTEFGHVGEQRHGDRLADRLEFGRAFQRLREDHVGAGVDIGLHALDRLVEALDGAGVVDISAIVRSCRSELAQLPGTEAVELLETLATQVADRRSKAELDHAVAELTGDEHPPFAHPYHWAAFFTVGCERVELSDS